jgi:exopolyphosphatase
MQYTKPSPFRRLSLAVKYGGSYKRNAAPDSGLAHFLSTSKENYLRDVHAMPSKGGEWTVVMGNEAGGRRLIFHEAIISAD